VTPDLRAVLDLTARDRDLAAAVDRLAGPEGGRVDIAGLGLSAAAVLLPALLPRTGARKIVVVVPGEKDAEPLRSDLAFAAAVLRGPACRVAQFPPLEADPYQGMAPHLGVASERVLALRALRDPGEAIVVVPTRALIHPLPPPATFDAFRLAIHQGESVRPDDLSQFLLAAGYVRVDLVAAMGEFSRRGGIVDFFPCDRPGPVRVEFWGEEIESLRSFDPATQRSTGRLEGAAVEPVREYRWDGPAIDRLKVALEERRSDRRASIRGFAAPDDLADRIEALAAGRPFAGYEACLRLVEAVPATLFDYAPEALRVTWEQAQALSDLETVYVDLHAAFDLAETFGLPPPEDLLLARDTVAPEIGRARLRLAELPIDDTGRRRAVRIPCQPPRAYKGRLHELAADLKTAAGRTTLLLMESLGRVERLDEVLREYDLAPTVIAESGPPAGAATSPPVGRLLIGTGRLSQGFVIPGAAVQVLTDREVFGEHVEREARPRRVAAFSAGFRDLKVGDLVVHVEHGIGRYAGIVRVGEDGGGRDFMLLAYEGHDKLYVPVDRLDLVQRYSGVAGQRAHLDRLGTQGWEKTKKKVRRAVQEMAQDLLQLYAARRAARGHVFPPDGPWQKEFEDAFPFELTPDQDRAVREVKIDMQNDGPMDRLICGDVGFGKTEVAMRAAFKAVMDGKQVAILCPTTVLAFQHLNTFRERFSAWPVTVDMVSRFRSPREQRMVVQAAAQGKVDILIGTHRILSQDVRFHDLGLLVVDEEQRFGVAHKERIKSLRKDVHVLTLTATPIPRTLQMSLAGVRDMSVIATPPENRLAIQTAIVPFREGVIATAIRNELKRGGQVYFVHNRVESIGSVAKLLHKLVPEARVTVAHGQMSEGLLEKTMMRFLAGEHDVLLATTIIENGLDIPRVNTLVVNRADRFGLAQLYQIRGRVGRSDRRAYAYLLVPARTPLQPLARRRLKALQEFSDLGSGFRVAAMDLEIRGAGNMLGREQSGHIAAVGFEMYCRLLDQTVREIKGEPAAPEVRAQINLGIDLKIPEEVVADFGDRLALYKRIASAADEAELGRLREEIADVYGKVPRQADNLLGIAALRQGADRLRIRSIDGTAGRIQIRFGPDTAVAPDRLVEMAARRPGTSLSPEGVLKVDLAPSAAGVAGEAARIEAVRLVLQALGACASIDGPSRPSETGPSNADT